MFVADAGDTEYELSILRTEIYAVRILETYDTGFLYGAFACVVP